MLEAKLVGDFKNIFLPFFSYGLVLGLLGFLPKEAVIQQVAIRGIEGLFNSSLMVLFFNASIVFTGLFLIIFSAYGDNVSVKTEGLHAYFSDALALLAVSQLGVSIGLLLPLFFESNQAPVHFFLNVCLVLLGAYVIALSNYYAKKIYLTGVEHPRLVGGVVGAIFALTGLFSGFYLTDWQALAK